ncbi:MAG: hypothetical protein ACLR2G_00045 [Phascolarctobacterium faecium]
MPNQLYYRYKGNSYYDGLDTAMTDDGSGDGTLDLDTIGKTRYYRYCGGRCGRY